MLPRLLLRLLPLETLRPPRWEGGGVRPLPPGGNQVSFEKREVSFRAKRVEGCEVDDPGGPLALVCIPLPGKPAVEEGGESPPGR